MKIGLISDTHGHLDPKVLEHFKDCDEIWHAGDIGTVELLDQLEEFKPTRAVFGNIDGHEIRIRTNEDLRFNCEGINIWMTHIGGYPPKYNSRIRPLIHKQPPDLFICGHSHILKIMRDPKINNLLYINPGAAGIHGFHKIKTLVRFEINAKNITNMQVIELGARGKL